MEKETVTIEGPGTTTVTASLKSYSKAFVEKFICECGEEDCECNKKKDK